MTDENARDVPGLDELPMPEDPDLDYVPSELLASGLRLVTGDPDEPAWQAMVIVPSLFRRAAELRGQSRLDER